MLYSFVLGLIQKKPLGYGLMGQRSLIYDYGYKWGYSHDLFLDLLVEYGVILGGLIIILLFVGIGYFLTKVKNIQEKMLFIVFLTVSCEMLLSNYYWLHYGLWALLGLFVNHFVSDWTRVGWDKMLGGKLALILKK